MSAKSLLQAEVKVSRGLIPESLGSSNGGAASSSRCPAHSPVFWKWVAFPSAGLHCSPDGHVTTYLSSLFLLPMALWASILNCEFFQTSLDISCHCEVLESKDLRWHWIHICTFKTQNAHSHVFIIYIRTKPPWWHAYYRSIIINL